MTNTSALPQDSASARQLVEHDWAYAVEELVEHAYSAIIAELDMLAAH